VTADNWSFVIAAYVLAFVVLATYWRFLSRREKELAMSAEHTGVSNPRSGRPSP
jgi:hypothetical protein